jgi:hypothetical protein
MVAGLAPNAEMEGTEPPGFFDEPLKPAQPLNPSEARNSIASPNRFGPQKLGPKKFAQTSRHLRKLLNGRPNSTPQKSPECIRAPFLALVPITHKSNNLRQSITTGRKASVPLSVRQHTCMARIRLPLSSEGLTHPNACL